MLDRVQLGGGDLAGQGRRRLGGCRGRVRQAANKVIHSGTLETVDTARTRIERAFDPEAVRRLTASAGI
jgi:hypothetical protein